MANKKMQMMAALADDDVVAPAGYERGSAARLRKHDVDDDAPVAADVDVDVDAAKRAVKAVDAGAVAVDHGKKAGAGNALAFHSWKKASKPST